MSLGNMSFLINWMTSGDSGHLISFYIFTFMNNVAIKMEIKMSLQHIGFISYYYMPRNGLEVSVVIFEGPTYYF